MKVLNTPFFSEFEKNALEGARCPNIDGRISSTILARVSTCSGEGACLVQARANEAFTDA